MRCMVPRPAPTHEPCWLRGPSRARVGLDPDGPPGGLWPLRHGGHQTAGLLGTECRSPSACWPQKAYLSGPQAQGRVTADGLMEPTLGAACRGLRVGGSSGPSSPHRSSLELAHRCPVTAWVSDRLLQEGLGGPHRPAGFSPAALSGSREGLASISLPQGTPHAGGGLGLPIFHLPRVSRPPRAVCPTTASPSAPGPETGRLPAGERRNRAGGLGTLTAALSPQWTGSPSSETWSTSA